MKPKELMLETDDFRKLEYLTDTIKNAFWLERAMKKNAGICKACAQCCYRIYDYLDVEVMKCEEIPEEMTEVREGGPGNEPGRWMKRREDGSCIALDQKTNLCTIYEKRPLDCRAFVTGNPVCLLIKKEDP